MGTCVPVHPATSVQAALDMAARGLSATEIGRVLDCPRSTVRAWLTPTARSADGRDATCCSGCGAVHLTAETEPAAYAYLLGLYLGDGCISAHARGVFRLRIALDTRYPGIIEECRVALSAVAPRNKVGVRLRSGGFETSKPDSNVELSEYAKWWPCVLPQHGRGRKHERPIVLEGWQERLVDEHPGRLLRGLIHSDGCRFVNTGTNWRSPRYSFSNRSADIRQIFCGACDRLGLRWTLAPHTVYVSRKDDVARLDEFVGPKR